jgi:hypothetical protein
MARRATAEKRDEYLADPALNEAVSPWYWALNRGLQLQSGLYLHKNHEYLGKPLIDNHPQQVTKKGAQMGFTEKAVLKTLHGMIHKRFPLGALHLFPTADDVTDFSKARFNPLIEQNYEAVGRFVQSTDAVNIKRIHQAILYLRGAKSTRQIEGLRKTSSKLKSIPVDRIVFDERDEMDQDMIDLAKERTSHSTVKEYEELSTPSIPDYGIDRSYNLSDQHVWMIPCGSCGHKTCLELEFPNCLAKQKDGRVIRCCVKCGAEIFPFQGEWEALFPGRPTRGWWISQLNSMYVDPSEILRAYQNLNQPGYMSAQEFYNSKLARAYVEATNRLTRRDLERCLTQDAMSISHDGPCAMCVDFGTWLHVVGGIRPNEHTRKIIYLARVKEWNDLHNIALRFGVQCAVIDGEPEKHKAREFANAEPYSVFLCDYQEGQRGAPRWDMERREVVGNRTELLDRTHALITGQTAARARIFELPSRSLEVEEYIDEATNIVKVLIVDRSGGQTYVYKALGADHYRHATVYFDLACERVGVATFGHAFRTVQNFTDDYDPLALSKYRERAESTDYDPLGRR